MHVNTDPLIAKKEKSFPPRPAPLNSNYAGKFLALSDLLTMKSQIVNVKPIKIRINKDEYEVKNWAQADEVFVNWLMDNGILKRSDLPIYSGKKKYYINVTDQHSTPELNGSWKQVKNGVWVDVKYNAPYHIKNMLQALKQLNADSNVNVSIILNQ